MWGRRIVLTLRLYIRSAIRPREVDSTVMYAVVAERERAVVIRKKGHTVLAPRGTTSPPTPLLAIPVGLDTPIVGSAPDHRPDGGAA